MRFECVRDDIPKKWAELELLPGMGDDWILIQSNGVMDPTKTEMIINQPAPEFRGTFDEANAELEKRIKYITEVLGYIKVQEIKDEDAGLLPSP